VVKGSLLPIEWTVTEIAMSQFPQALPLMVLLVTGCVGEPLSAPVRNDAQEKAQIRHVLDQIVDACEKKDFDRLDSYHLYGTNFTKFDTLSTTQLDAAAAREGEHRGLSTANDLHMQADDLNIAVFDNTGISTFILSYSFKAGAVTMQRKVRSTLVFVKDHGGWRIVHEHLSPLPTTQ